MKVEERKIRAHYDEKTITVYQAYNKIIAESAVRNQTFVSPPFKLNRMTWIKPSFFWMMYRSGWATKKNQEHILAIKITRKGFDWAIQNGCLSHYDPNIYESSKLWKAQLKESNVRIQWDPDRDVNMNKLDTRAVQIGLSGMAVKLYVNDWILSIDDITSFCKQCYLSSLRNPEECLVNVPSESLYVI